MLEEEFNIGLERMEVFVGFSLKFYLVEMAGWVPAKLAVDRCALTELVG